jgi:hypothetical protein
MYSSFRQLDDLPRSGYDHLKLPLRSGQAALGYYTVEMAAVNSVLNTMVGASDHNTWGEYSGIVVLAPSIKELNNFQLGLLREWNLIG